MMAIFIYFFLSSLFLIWMFFRIMGNGNMTILLEGTYHDLEDARSWNQVILRPALKRAKQNHQSLCINIEADKNIPLSYLQVALDTRDYVVDELPRIYATHPTNRALTKMANDVLFSYRHQNVTFANFKKQG